MRKIMKGLTKDNGKVSDSGYTNTCVSQSPRSSGSSLSRNSNRSESSGYCGGHPSTFGFSNYALPKPIRQRKEHKKSKATTTASILGIKDTKLGQQIVTGEQSGDVGSYNPLGSTSDFNSLCKKSEEVAGVESIDATELGEHNGDSNSTEPEGGVGTKTNPLEDTTSNTNAGFAAVISLHNGLVVDTTPSLKAALGYAREAWVGRSFIDFVHPKDKSTFADHLAKNLALPCGDLNPDVSGRQTLFCNLRKPEKGRSSATGSGSDESTSVNSRPSLFVPFYLTMSVKVYRQCAKEEMPGMMFLTINAQSVLPVYKAPEETIISSIFSTRHDPNCILTHVDHHAVRYFGYLPQDIIGRSLFDFYHPEDLPFIKDVYETVVKMEGSPFRSKPYRFATQNGGYVVLETEWSSFINPWREKIEFVIGRHRVLRGPANPDVFQPVDDCQRSLLSSISEEVFKESKIIQGEIRALLDEKIQRTDDTHAYDLSCRSKDLTIFVGNLLQEVKPPAPISKDSVPADDKSISEHDSVMLVAISPHHEYCDSKSSTETPPSYNQLNYNDKLERFFNSKPLVNTAFVSDEENVNSTGPINNDIGKSSPNLTGTKDTTPNDSGSGENLSNGSNNHTSFGSRDGSDNARSANTMPPESLKLPTLTESLLNKHNIDMEKLMAKQHKERRSEIKKKKQLHKSMLENSAEKSNEQNNKRRKITCNGKRCSSSESRGLRKVSKYDETVQTCTVTPVSAVTNNTPVIPMSVDDSSPSQAQSRPIMNIWPSTPVAVPPQQTSHLCMPTQNLGLQEASRCPTFTPIVPLYCLSVPRIREDSMNTTHQFSNQFSHNGQIQQNSYVSYIAAPMAGLMYPPVICTPAPFSTMCRPFVAPEPAPIPRETPQSNSIVQRETCSHLKRPTSQATSVKAEPGSIMAMSESSKKVLSPGEHFSSCVSIDGGCSSLVDIQTTANTKRETNTNSQFESSLEDSSDSSFYGSFLNTSSDSNCNRDQTVAYAQQESPWKPSVSKSTKKEEKEQYDMIRKAPPWQEGVNITPELVYRYQLTPKPLSEILEADKKALMRFKQPQMVNDQLAQLYADMELVGFKTKLLLSDVDTSSDDTSESSGGNSSKNMPEHKGVRKDTNNSMMSMIYEEDAPLPSP